MSEKLAGMTVLSRMSKPIFAPGWIYLWLVSMVMQAQMCRQVFRWRDKVASEVKASLHGLEEINKPSEVKNSFQAANLQTITTSMI